MQLILDAYDAGVRFMCLAAATVFVVRFSRVRWRQTIEGRHLMHFSIMITAFLLLVVLRIIFGPQPWIEWAARILFGWMLYLIIERSVIQKRAQDEAEEFAASQPENHHQTISGEQHGRNLMALERRNVETLGEILKSPPKYAKAIVGGLIAGVGALATAYADNVLTAGEAWGAAAVALTAFGAVFGVENKQS